MSEDKKCVTCKGTGEKWIDDATNRAAAMAQAMGDVPPCPECNGTGNARVEQWLGKPCTACGGTGIGTRSDGEECACGSCAGTGEAYGFPASG